MVFTSKAYGSVLTKRLCVLVGVLSLLGEDGGLNHILVPKHELLSKEDSEKVLKELGVKLWQLPRIYQDDPAIRHLNPEVGQLVKITRSSELAGEYVVYRVVVSSLTAKSTTTEKKEEKAEKRKTKEKSATKSRTTSKSRKKKAGKSTSKSKRSRTREG